MDGLGFTRRKYSFSIFILPDSEESKRLQYSDFLLTLADTDWIVK